MRFENGCRTVIIRNLSVFVQYKDIVELANRCGQIMSLNLDRNANNRATCFVNFLETEASKIFYMALNNKHLRFENQDGLEFDRLQKLLSEREGLDSQLNALMEEWEQINEHIEEIELILHPLI